MEQRRKITPNTKVNPVKLTEKYESIPMTEQIVGDEATRRPKPLIDKQITKFPDPATDNIAKKINTEAENPLLQCEDTINYLPLRHNSKKGYECNTESVLLTLVETPPLLCARNIVDLMTRLKNPITTRENIHKMLEKDSVNVHTALETILQDWFVRKSSTASLESLILQLRICNLNSHADALKKRFYEQDRTTGQISADIDHLHTRSKYDYFHNEYYSTAGEDIDNVYKSSNGISEHPKHRKLRAMLISLSILWCILVFMFVLQSNHRFLKNTSDYTENATLIPTSVTWVSYDDIKEIQKKSNQQDYSKNCQGQETEYIIAVESYESLKLELSNLGQCDMLSVLITSKDFKAWPTNLSLLREYNIVNITIEGDISTETVYEILRQSGNTVYLHLNNISDRLHSETPELSSDCSIECGSLKYLSLGSFKFFDDVLELLTTCVRMYLCTFDFYGKISDESAYQIFHLIQANRKTLEEISITGSFETSFFIIPFDKPMYFSKSLNIKVYVTSYYVDPRVIISKQFCNLFPEIVDIKLDIPVGLEQVKMLQNCNKLEVIDVNLSINLHETVYDVINIAKKFRKLKSLVISINFIHGCPNSTILKDFRTKIIEGKYHNLHLCSNCAFHRQIYCMLVGK